ncbi:MAG: hypothetical protein ACO1OO_11605 [Flavisolibacter sp.]
MQHILLYIDPGSGSYLLQAIIAGVLGVVFFFKNIAAYVRHQFYRFFRSKSKVD